MREHLRRRRFTRAVNGLQMQGASPSAEPRGARLWSRRGDPRSPCLSQNATRTGPSLKCVSQHLHLRLKESRGREAGWAHPPSVASAGPVSHSDRLLLVRHQRRKTSERLLRAQQDSGVFRYCGNKEHPEEEGERKSDAVVCSA